MRVDKKIAHKCYENSLRDRKGTHTIVTQVGGPSVEIESASMTKGDLGPREKFRERDKREEFQAQSFITQRVGR